MEQIEKIVEELSEPRFYGIKEVSNMLGWAMGTIQDLFNREDFPSTDFGKEKKVEREALKEYFRVPRRR